MTMPTAAEQAAAEQAASIAESRAISEAMHERAEEIRAQEAAQREVESRGIPAGDTRTYAEIAAEGKTKEFANQDRAKWLAEQAGISQAEAYKLIVQYQKDPSNFKVMGMEVTGKDNQFMTMEDKAKLAAAAGVRYDPTSDWMATHIQVGINRQQRPNPNYDPSKPISETNAPTTMEPEYISKTDAEKMKAENPNLWDVMLRNGIEAYNNQIKEITKYQQAEIQAQQETAAKQKAEYAKLEERLADEGLPTGKALQKTVEDFKKNPLDPKYNLESAGGTITVRQKQILAELAGIEYDAQKDWLNSHVQVGIKNSGEPQYIAKKDADKIKAEIPEMWGVMLNEGPEAFDSKIKQSAEEYQNAKKVLQGYIVPEKREEISAISVGGMTPKKTVTTFEDLNKEPTYDIVKYLKENPDKQETLKNAGFSEEVIKAAAYNSKLNKAQSVWQGMTPWDEYKGENANPKQVAQMVAELAVPYYAVITKWDSLTPAERATYLAIDTLSLIPIMVVGGRAISTAVRAGMSIEKAIATTVGRELLAQVTAPYTLVRHPLETMKAPYVLVREALGNRTVPIESVIGSISAPAAKYGMSDVRMAVGAGGEVAGATKQSMSELQRALALGEEATTTQGLRLAEMTPTGMQEALGAKSVVHTGPAFENMIPTLKKEGKIVVEGEEGGLYTAGTGALFYQQAAHGGTGQIKFAAIIDIPNVEPLPRELANIKDANQLEKMGKKLLNTGTYYNETTEGIKVYRKTAEGELIITNQSELIPVTTGREKTWKWIAPDPVIAKQASDLRAIGAEKLKEYESIVKKTGETTATDALKKDIEKIYKDANKLDKDSLLFTNQPGAGATEQKAKLDIDSLTMYDPTSNEKVMAIHFRLPDVPNKPWGASQVKALKEIGYRNVIRDITTPALKYPEITPERTIALMRERLAPNPSELSRLNSGLDLSTGLSNQKMTTEGLKLDFTKVKMMPNTEAARNVEKVLQKYGDEVVMGGSTVDQLFTGEKVIASDLDTYAKNFKAVARDLQKAYEDAGIKTTLKEVTLAEMKGGPGYQIRAAEDIKGLNQAISKDEIIQEIHSLDYHRKTPVTGNPDIVGYGMAHGLPPIEVNGIYYEQLGELFNRRLNVLLFPGFGEKGTLEIGPEAAYLLNRMKDIPKAELEGRALIDAAKAEAARAVGAERSAKLARVEKLEQDFNTLMKGQIPNEITDNMAAGLKALGHTDEEIKNMKVSQALSELGIKVPQKEQLTKIGTKVAEAIRGYAERGGYLERTFGRMPAVGRALASPASLADLTRAYLQKADVGAVYAGYGVRLPERPSIERPVIERPPIERPPSERPVSERPSGKRPPAERPPTERPPTERPPTERPPIERAPAERPVAERPPTERPPIERPPAERPPTERPPTERPPVERPPIERPPTERPPTERPPTERPPIERNQERVRRRNRLEQDNKNRQLIATAYSAVTYKRGELGGKRVGEGDNAYYVGGLGVWHTFIKRTKYSKLVRIITLGAKPEGAVYASGPESAKRTMQRLAGKEPINILEDTGAVDTALMSQAGEKKVSPQFIRDKTVTQRTVRQRTAEPRPIDLGAGIIQEGRRGRRHIK